jgi:hypothetical protein
MQREDTLGAVGVRAGDSLLAVPAQPRLPVL